MTKKASHKSALTTTAPAAGLRPRAPTPPAAIVQDARQAATRLVELAGAIERTLCDLDSREPGAVRHACLTVEADLLRLGIAAVDLRAVSAALGNAAHVAELAAMTSEARGS